MMILQFLYYSQEKFTAKYASTDKRHCIS
jgi:hypothetical protein